MNSRLARILTLFVTLGTLALATEAASAAGVKVGTLSCNLAPTVGFIVGSRQRLTCRYTPDGPWPPEIYIGHLSTAGLDIGVEGGARMVWAVFASIESGCSAIERREPPTRAFAPSPTPTATSALAPI